jgi:hypothetical protein
MAMTLRFLSNVLFSAFLCMASWAHADDGTYGYPHRGRTPSDPKVLEELTSPSNPVAVKKPVKGSKDPRLTFRVVTEKELLRKRDKDRDMTLGRTWEILARLNHKAVHYITRDIKDGSPLYVPNDFSAYKAWTPVPLQLEELGSVPKFILLVKEIPFLAWYQDGQLVGDSVVCVGKTASPTHAGLYQVRNKDIDHISRSYKNAYGMPAPMPYALRVYGHVWIHAGDIASGYCSHGCINLPLRVAEELYAWTDVGTVVLIAETLADLDRYLERQGSNSTQFARKSSSRRAAQRSPTVVAAEATDR